MNKIYINDSSLIFQNAFFDLGTGSLLSPIETQNYIIVQVAESNYRGSFCIENHLQHFDIELTYPLTEGLCCSTDGNTDKLKKHETYISFKGDMHKLSSHNSCRFQTLAFNFKSGPCADLLNQIKQIFTDERKVFLTDISELYSSIIAEFISPDTTFFKINLDALITSVLVKLVRFIDAKPKIGIQSTEEKIPLIINYIDSNFLKISSLDELSVRFGYTYSHICKVFKKTYGKTPSEYVLYKKSEYSIELLKKGKDLSEIAEILGYSTPYNYSRAFKRVYGVSPTNYCKNNNIK